MISECEKVCANMSLAVVHGSVIELKDGPHQGHSGYKSVWPEGAWHRKHSPDPDEDLGFPAPSLVSEVVLLSLALCRGAIIHIESRCATFVMSLCSVGGGWLLSWQCCFAVPHYSMRQAGAAS